MAKCVLVFDLETVPDLPAIARAHGLDDPDEAAAREALWEKLAKDPFHQIVCIGTLIAEQVDREWQVRSIDAPHAEKCSERELIAGFVNRIAELRPRLVTFNSSRFVRYRVMVNTLSAPGLTYYVEDAVDLCDCLSFFSSNAKVKLPELCRALGLPGKPDEIDSAKVEEFVSAGRFAEVASHYECHVVSTFRAWLRYEFSRGMLSRSEFDASEDNLFEYLTGKLATKPQFADLLGGEGLTPSSRWRRSRVRHLRARLHARRPASPLPQPQRG